MKKKELRNAPELEIDDGLMIGSPKTCKENIGN